MKNNDLPKELQVAEWFKKATDDELTLHINFEASRRASEWRMLYVPADGGKIFKGIFSGAQEIIS